MGAACEDMELNLEPAGQLSHVLVLNTNARKMPSVLGDRFSACVPVRIFGTLMHTRHF